MIKSFLSLLHVAMVIYFMLTPARSYAALNISGPTTVCPKGTYTYTANGANFATNRYRWYLSYDQVSIVNSGQSPTTSFDVQFNSGVPGVAYLKVDAVNTNLPGCCDVLETTTITIYRSLPKPVTPNGGTVLFCGPNETVTVNSSPYIPFNPTNSSDVASCLFHCSYNWQVPSGWVFSQGVRSPSNDVDYSSPTNDLQSPSNASNGNNGFVIINALYSQCSYDVNSSSSAVLWVGAPAVSNGQVNGSPAGSPVYVPGGYANLSVNSIGGGSLNWYIANGSGSLYPSGNNASINFSGFVRVIVESSNRCGNGGSWTFYLNSESGGYGYRVGPNPAKDQVSVMPEYPELVGELIQDITLYDDKGKVRGNTNHEQLKKERAAKKTSIDFNTKGLAKGTYFLHVKTGDEVHKHQIVLE